MSAGSGRGGGVVFERHDSDFGDSDALENIHDGNKFLDRQFEVGAHDDGGVRFVGLQSGEAGLEIGGSDDRIVDFEDIVFIDRDVEGLRRIRGSGGCGAFRNDQVHTVFDEGCCDHKNNQQHKNQIQHGRDIQLRERVQAVFRRVASHAGSEERSTAFAVTELDIAVLDFGRELGGEIVGLHEERAQRGDQKIVAEHRWNGHEEADDGGDERA
jgi:hypothetical protein